MNFIFINGKIETLSFFSKQLADRLSDMGHSTYIHEFYNGISGLAKHIDTNNTILITFNCIGVSGEEEYMVNSDVSFWRAHNISIINILVDHPLYYHSQLSNPEKYGTNADKYLVICIDRYHLKYLNSYYPEIKNSYFMPLAGSGSEYACSLNKKKYDVIFTGNFTPCSHFDKYIERNGSEYTEFYHGIIDDLLVNTQRPIEEVCISHIMNEIPDAGDNDIRQVMNNMIFIDLYVRFYMREKVIRAVSNAGINLRLVGKGFEAIRLDNGKTLSGTPLMPTGYCLKETSLAKISLNVMPWFRDGSHDRILSSMMCGAVALTDNSIWLCENFNNMTDICFYDLNDTDGLVSCIFELLDNPAVLTGICSAGHKKALESHTWESRALEIVKLINQLQ